MSKFTKIPMPEMIAAVRAYSMSHYEHNGWDYVVECYTDEDIANAIGKATSVRGAIENMLLAIKPRAEYRDEIRAEIF